MIPIVLASCGPIYLFPMPCLLASTALLFAVAYLQARAAGRSWCPFGLPAWTDRSTAEVALACVYTGLVVLMCLIGPWQIYLLTLAVALIALSLRQREVDPDKGRAAVVLLRGGWAVALGLTLLALQGVPFEWTAMADLARCKGNLKTLAEALEEYSSDHEGEYPASLDQLTPGYLPDIPRCGPPEPARALYECQGVSFGDRHGDYHYTLTPGGYLVSCKSKAHERTAGCPPGYPRYTPEEGILHRP